MHSPSKALLLTTCRRLWQTSSIRLSSDSLHNGCIQFLHLTKVLGISSFAYRILPLFHLSCNTSIASERDCCKGWTLSRLVIRYKHIRWFNIFTTSTNMMISYLGELCHGCIFWVLLITILIRPGYTNFRFSVSTQVKYKFLELSCDEHFGLIKNISFAKYAVTLCLPLLPSIL